MNPVVAYWLEFYRVLLRPRATIYHFPQRRPTPPRPISMYELV